MFVMVQMSTLFEKFISFGKKINVLEILCQCKETFML